VWKIPLNSTAESVSSFTVNTAFESPQTSPVGTVTLTIAAPSGGQPYTLLSSNTAVAQVPASGTVAAGATSGTFNIINQYVSTSTTITLTATVNGTSKAVSYTVKPPVPEYIYATSMTVKSGATDLCGFQLTANAPTGGATITLKSSNTALATVPATMSIGAGARRANFTITTKALATQSTVTITGTYDGGSASVTVTLTPSLPAISAFTAHTTFYSPETSPVGTVILTIAAPSGGQTYTLASSNTNVAQVPASGSIAAGATAASFYIINQYVASTATITLTATVNGTSKAISYTVSPPVPEYIYATYPSIKGGTDDLCGFQLNGNAPPAGATITLHSANTALATVNATMTIGGGARRANFYIYTKAVTKQSTVVVSGTYNGGTASITITITP
jgi:trimeric autotransporter adhesin